MTPEEPRKPGPPAELVERCGGIFRRPERAAGELLRISGGDGTRALRLAALISSVPDPGGALGHLERMEAAGSVPAGDDALRCLVLILGHSSYLAETLLTDRDAFRAALEARSRPAPAADTYRAALRRALRTAPSRERWREILRFKNRQLAAIALRDFLGEWSLAEVVEQISHLAGALLEEAMDESYREMTGRYGPPSGDDEAGRRQRATACLVALGKLGGLELNYSSDVDLLFIYSHDGETRGAGRDRSTVVTNKEFFTRMAQALTRRLTGSEGGGWVLRVDWGLRPGGQDGDLALPLGATLGYYRTWARPWEKQALIKARPVAGDIRLGRRFVAGIQELVYPQEAGAGATDAIREMKDRIDSSLATQGRASTDLKLGRGGIREIEFNVQGRQILHGGRDPWLRDPSTLHALHRLVEKGHLSRVHHSALSSAYEFLRKAEHRIQIRRNLQRSTLPRDGGEMKILARSMGYGETEGSRAGEAFLRDLDRHRAEVRALYDEFIASQSQERLEPGGARDPFLDPMADSEMVGILGRAGWADPEAHLPEMRRASRHLTGPMVPVENRRAFRQVTPVVLREIPRVANPGRALRNLERLLESLVVDPAGMLAFLEKAERFAPILGLFGGSQHLADLLIHRPALMLEPSFDRALVTDRTLTDHARAIRDLLKHHGSYADRLAALRRYQHGELLIIGLKDVSGQINIRSVRKSLSDLAEACVRGACQAAAARQEEAGEEPVRPFSVLALGRLGYREMDYGSDLDLVFIYHPSAPDAEVHARACRLAARIVEALGTITREGPLYAVDSRLRPFGGQGELAQSSRSLLDYLRDSAGVWEMQSYLKVRAVAGDLRAGKRLVRRLEQAILDRAAGMEPAGEIRSMREKLREASQHRDDDLKSGAGGTHTVQFALQYLQLRHHVPSPARKSTLRVMRSLRDLDLLDEGTYTRLYTGERLLRRIEHQLRLIRGRSVACLPENEELLAEVAAQMDYPGPAPRAVESMMRDMESARQAIEEAYEAVVPADPPPGAD